MLSYLSKGFFILFLLNHEKNMGFLKKECKLSPCLRN